MIGTVARATRKHVRDVNNYGSTCVCVCVSAHKRGAQCESFQGSGGRRGAAVGELLSLPPERQQWRKETRWFALSTRGSSFKLLFLFDSSEQTRAHRRDVRGGTGCLEFLPTSEV